MGALLRVKEHADICIDSKDSHKCYRYVFNVKEETLIVYVLPIDLVNSDSDYVFEPCVIINPYGCCPWVHKLKIGTPYTAMCMMEQIREAISYIYRDFTEYDGAEFVSVSYTHSATIEFPDSFCYV